MTADKEWLSFKVSKKLAKQKPKVLISVPKRIVPRATKRNRIKRLIREVVRKESFFGREQTIFIIKVNALAFPLTLEKVRQQIQYQ